MRCKKCGAELRSGALYCHECGCKNNNFIDDEEIQNRIKKYLKDKANKDDIEEIKDRLTLSLPYIYRCEYLEEGKMLWNVVSTIEDDINKYDLYYSKNQSNNAAIVIYVILIIVSAFFAKYFSRDIRNIKAVTGLIAICIVLVIIIISRLSKKASYLYHAKAAIKEVLNKHEMYGECEERIHSVTDLCKSESNHERDIILNSCLKNDCSNSLRNKFNNCKKIKQEIDNVFDKYYDEASEKRTIISDLVPEKYNNSKDVESILEMFVDGRAFNMKEAINLVVYEMFEREKLEAIKQASHSVKNTMEGLAKKHNEELKKQTDKLDKIQKNLNDMGKKQ